MFRTTWFGYLSKICVCVCAGVSLHLCVCVCVCCIHAYPCRYVQACAGALISSFVCCVVMRIFESVCEMVVFLCNPCRRSYAHRLKLGGNEFVCVEEATRDEVTISPRPECKLIWFRNKRDLASSNHHNCTRIVAERQRERKRKDMGRTYFNKWIKESARESYKENEVC